MRSDKRSDKFLRKKTPDLRFFSWLGQKRSDIPTHFAKLPLRARERLTGSNATFMNVSRFCGSFRGKNKDRRSGQRGRAVCSAFRVRFALFRVVFRRLWRAGAADDVEAAMPPAFALDIPPFAVL